MKVADVALPTGTLEVSVQAAEPFSLEQLCGFAARNNPRRGFLFMSKLLGKHWPCRPRDMTALHRHLAMQLPESDAEGLLFVGMAETATGLGHGVFEAYLERQVGPALYLQTTRYTLSGATELAFDENHSHATRLHAYLPDTVRLRQRVERASTLVICDDEASSGRTFAALASALRTANTNLRHVCIVLITDFSDGQAAERMRELAGIESVRVISALRGSYRFAWNDSAATLVAPPPAVGAAGCRRTHISQYSARLGLEGRIALPAQVIAACQALQRPGRCLVLGTGELMHAAYRLACELERQDTEVFVQATTRSPILIAADIHSVVNVADPYGEHIANYLYNFEREAYSQVYLVHETPQSAATEALCRAIAGRVGCVEVALLAGQVRSVAGREA
jgi:Phosphoribosyl transferase/TRSP domain C terminus to PRTase_2